MSSTPPIMRAAWVNRTPEDAFAVFTDEIGAWWPLPTHGMFGPESGAVAFRNGQLIEQARDGSEVVWAEVRTWQPPTRLVVAWHPGRDIEEATEVEVTFEPDQGGTRLLLEHRGWETFGSDAASRRLGYVGPNAWGYVLDHFSSGAEVRPDAVDVAGLVAAYDAFYDEALLGRFGPPPDGEWTADETLAHVALNDVAMLAVTQAIVHQNTTTFENVVCQDPAVLARQIGLDDSLEERVARGRALARLVCRSVQRLDPAQLDSLVECRLLHDGEVVVDEVLPWRAVVVDTQAQRHLPAHVEQLQNLRT